MTLTLEGLTVRYGSGRSAVAAVSDVNLSVPAGKTLGLVGESGSGKSTLARAIVGLTPPAAGRVLVDGEPFSPGNRRARRAIQLVFQDPYASLNPRMTVRETLEESISTHRSLGARGPSKEVEGFLALVDLDRSTADRYPHQLSGGQRQRVAIARALSVEPQVIIADEVTSSLDVSVQAKVLNVLRDVQGQLGVSYLFISHNLSVVRYMSDEVAVMYLGRLVEVGSTEALFDTPRHPYTEALIEAVPQVGKAGGGRLPGEIPDPRHPPSGCPFHTRCPVGPLFRPDRVKACQTRVPPLDGETHRHACHFPLRSPQPIKIHGSVNLR